MKTTLVALAMLGAAAHAGDLAGHYYLQNVREVGSELLLKPDGTFDYMLAYGAADYWAKGTWRTSNGAVILNSGAGQPPGLHFDWCGASPRRFLASVCSSWHHKDARCRTSM